VLTFEARDRDQEAETNPIIGKRKGSKITNKKMRGEIENKCNEKRDTKRLNNYKNNKDQI